MADSPFRVAAIGCGARGRSLLRHAAGAADVEIAALYDPNPQAALQAQREHAPDAAIVDGIEQVVSRDDVDLVIVGSPDHAHREPAVAAFEHGKHVFCEKPLATTAEDCRAIWSAAQAAERELIVGFVLRYAPFYRGIKERLDHGDLGPIMSIEANENLPFAQGAFFRRDWRRFRRFTGTYLLEKCCHDLDILCWFADSLPLRVASFGGRSFFTPRADAPLYCRDCDLDCAHRLELDPLPPKPATEPELTRGKDLDLCCFNSSQDIVDNQVVIIEFANGVRATFHSNQNAASPSRRMYLVGERGCIEGDIYWGFFQYAPIRYTGDWEGLPWERTEVVRAGQHGGGDDSQLGDCLRRLRDGRPVMAGGREGLIACVTALGIDEARGTGSVVDLTGTWGAYGLSDGAGAASGGRG